MLEAQNDGFKYSHHGISATFKIVTKIKKTKPRTKDISIQDNPILKKIISQIVTHGDQFVEVGLLKNAQLMLSFGLIDEKTRLTEKQADGFNSYSRMNFEGNWGDNDKFVTDDIGLLRKDNFIKAYIMMNQTTENKATKEYTKAQSKRRKMILEGYVPKIRINTLRRLEDTTTMLGFGKS